MLLNNPDGIGFVTDEWCKQTLKMETLKKIVCDYNIDIVVLTEVNKDWQTLDYSQTLFGKQYLAEESIEEYRLLRTQPNLKEKRIN